ncbi:hypothetical protein [Prochlorothrix hollandica]|uniref:hypothetical protein n=1 Tax=Prochlorothrix hollandica TaxID=1223 RepID=UPI003340EAAE
MKTLNNRQVLEEVFNLLMQQMEPWKAAHFWAMGQFGDGDYLQQKYEHPDPETFDELVQDILKHQSHP